MILPDFKAFPRTGRIVGIDWGASRTGVAVSDATREFTFVRSPILARRAGPTIAQQIADVARVENAVGIIIGLPHHGDGTESETAKMVRACANELSGYIDLPICFVDESYSSVAAQSDMGRVRRADIKQKLDSESARVILENAIAIISRIK